MMNLSVKRSLATASNPTDDLWDSIQTARFLKCSITRLLRLAAAGEIPATKVGRGWIFDPNRVRSWLAARMVAAK